MTPVFVSSLWMSLTIKSGTLSWMSNMVLDVMQEKILYIKFIKKSRTFFFGNVLVSVYLGCPKTFFVYQNNVLTLLYFKFLCVGCYSTLQDKVLESKSSNSNNLSGFLLYFVHFGHNLLFEILQHFKSSDETMCFRDMKKKNHTKTTLTSGQSQWRSTHHIYCMNISTIF